MFEIKSYLSLCYWSCCNHVADIEVNIIFFLTKDHQSDFPYQIIVFKIFKKRKHIENEDTVYSQRIKTPTDAKCPLGFPGDSDGKESACNSEDLGSIPASGRYCGERNGNPHQYSCLENSMDRGA